MVGTGPKAAACPQDLRKALTVSAGSQVLHLKLVAHQFIEQTRRVRPSSRARMRLSSEHFDTLCDYACIFSAVLEEAKTLASFTPEKEQLILKSFFQLLHGQNYCDFIV